MLIRATTAEPTGPTYAGAGSGRGSLAARSSPQPGLDATVGRSSGCATRRHETGRRWKGSAVGLSQQPGEAGGSLTWEAPGRAGSSPDNDGTGRYRQTARARQARRRGVRVQEPVVEPPKAIRRPQTWWIWAGQQRTPLGNGWVTPRRAIVRPAWRPRGRAAAYLWRGCRGIAGRRGRRPVAW